MTWVSWEADTFLYQVFLLIEAIQYGKEFSATWTPHVSFQQGTPEYNGNI